MGEIRRFTKIIMSADGTPGASAEAPKFEFEIGNTVKRDRPFRVTTKEGKTESVTTATVVDRVEETDGKLWYWVEVIDSIGGEHYGWVPQSSLELAS